MSSYRTWEEQSGKSETGQKDETSLKNDYKVDVESLPQKKGLVIKHVEYLVISEKHQSQVNGICLILTLQCVGSYTIM